MENGINDDLLTRFIGQDRIITCVTFAGGAPLAPGRYMNHDGTLYVGRRDGQITPQVRQVAAVAADVRPTTPTDQIRSIQWDKMSRVCLSVPTACISGLFLGDVFLHPETQTLFALLALELFAVAEADGCPRTTVEEKTQEEWTAIRDGKLTGLEHADTFKPVSYTHLDVYKRQEQKAVIVLLALLYLGVKNIHLGPTLPAFLSPNVAKVLVEQFGIAGIGTVEDDLKLFFGQA